MPIGSIILQPVTNSIHSAYRPVVLRVTATKTDGTAVPPVVYCDIYFAGVFYKSMPKTQYALKNGTTNTEWQFDIQDALQEYLSSIIEDNGTSDITEVLTMITNVYCKFRSSGQDADGFLVVEGTAPIQGNGEDPPVAGTGTQSNTFYGLNSALQHEDNQDLSEHLDSYKLRTWVDDTYPLTHRPDGYNLCSNDSDSFPILSDKPPLKIVLHYMDSNGTWQESGSAIPCNGAAPINSTNIPNAATGEIYSYVLNLSGTAPFNLTSVVKPSWMTIMISGSSIVFGGTPDDGDVATGVAVSFTINNCISSTYSFSEVIDVDCVIATYVGNPNIPNAVQHDDYTYELLVAGTLPITLNNVVKPSWMTIGIVGHTITFSGTPTVDATGEDVEFDIDNCGGTLVFDQVIDTSECIAVSITDNQLPNAVVGIPYDELVPYTGSVAFLNLGTSLPSWLSVAVEGNNLRFTGTPPTEATGEAITVVLSNCNGIDDTYTDSIDSIGLQHQMVENYTANVGGIVDVCTIHMTFHRTPQATTDATVTDERIQMNYTIVADNGCEQTLNIIFEPSELDLEAVINMMCGGTYYCTSAEVTVNSVTIIP